ncbi:MAG: hypothetical protein JNL74_10475, partial [Fibrobacteres bacterium]|nr:hypothetical protein [Fibrobacterota bacterium]
MHKSEHLLQTAEFFGDIALATEYEWVHDWLDELANKGIALHKHRKYRHHREALDTIFMDFCALKHPTSDHELAYKIAEQHIVDDMGFIPDDQSGHR